MRDLVAAQGAKLVFATSFGYLEPALRVAAEFPAAKFEHAGGYKSAPNLATYDARYYEARWLAGWLAGQASRSGVAGYVAGFPVPEVVQGINAFTLGMRAAKPKAQVRVLWLNTWFDPARERDAAQALIDQGADVLTHHSGSPAVAQTAQANFRTKGVRVVPYPSDMRAFAPEAQLAAIEHRWGGFYTRVAESVLAGTWKAEPTWGGIASGMVDIAAVDPALPEAIRARRAAPARGDRRRHAQALRRAAARQRRQRAPGERQPRRRADQGDGLVRRGRGRDGAEGALSRRRRARKQGFARCPARPRGPTVPGEPHRPRANPPGDIDDHAREPPCGRSPPAPSPPAPSAPLGTAQAQTKLKWAHVYETSEPFHKWSVWAGDEIKKRTNGKYEIQVFPASSLGKESDINQGLTLGTVDIILTGASFAGRTYPPLAVSLLPVHLPRRRAPC